MVKPAPLLESMVSSALAAVGYQLVACELSRQGRQSVLRVFIEHEPAVTAEDCAKASRQIAAVLDVEDPIAGAYILEVSSPGLDRPLCRREDYKRFQGQMIKLRLRVPFNNQRNFVGTLVALSEQDKVSLQTEHELVELDFSNIEKANLVPNLPVKKLR